MGPDSQFADELVVTLNRQLPVEPPPKDNILPNPAPPQTVKPAPSPSTRP